MDKNLLKEIKDKLDLVLSLFTIKEDGKEKTILEKYNEFKKEKDKKNENSTMQIRYSENGRRAGYGDKLKKIMEESFEQSGIPPKTDPDGFFIYENEVYNIKDYK